MHANISYTFIFPNFASPKLESGLGSELPMILYTEKHWKYFSTSEYIMICFTGDWTDETA
jgi:hypothetical protein